MQSVLRNTAWVIGIVTIALWFFSGPNWGRTKTSLSAPADTQVNTFLPGIDFLLGGALLAALLAIAAAVRWNK
jgi:hypothetical protein